ncbi:MAG: YggT family protein [Actinobacteria bacterium]|nr:MAG: YggT family protein [Actinomycetota bacterium]
MGVKTIIAWVIQAYVIVIFARVILSWFPITPGTPMASVARVLYSVTEPVLGPIRRVLPPMRMGGMGLDLSPIVVLIGLQIVSRAVLA